jgi:crotonobetainyl-CoA:carnitine CoA-transferase CaiB-like acyl-CoA transferase
MLLADFGADVVKVEPPEGDPQRALYQLPGTPPASTNYPWELAARHKRSLVLDLKQPEGQAVLHRLVAQADVFITNLPLAARARLGIAHAQLQPLNARLVYASMTAYGETGDEAGKTGFDITAYWARPGLMDCLRNDAQSPPVRPMAGMGDQPSAVTLYAAIATALYQRERTGQGGLVSTSLMANGVWANGVQVQAHLSGVRYPPRLPRSHAPNPLSNQYLCSDGRWINLVVLNLPRQWPALLQALGLAHLAQDPRFASAPARAEHGPALIAELDAAFARHSLAHWRKCLDDAGVTFGVVGTLDDVDHDSQMRAAGALLPCSHRDGLAVANPIQLQGQPQRRPGPAPALGQHSADLLQEAGYSAEEVAQLVQRRVLGSPI